MWSFQENSLQEAWLACLFCPSAFPFFLPGRGIGFCRWSNHHLTPNDHEGKITASVPTSWSHENVITEFYLSKHVQMQPPSLSLSFSDSPHLQLSWRSSNNERQSIHTKKGLGSGRETDPHTLTDFGFTPRQNHNTLTVRWVHRGITDVISLIFIMCMTHRSNAASWIKQTQ